MGLCGGDSGSLAGNEGAGWKRKMIEGQLSPSEIADQLVEDNGIFLHRSFLSDEEVEAYRLECEAFFRSGPRVAKWPGYGRNRLNRDRVADYVFSRSQAQGSRIYQFPANRHSPGTKAIFDRILSLRDAIEEHWLDDPAYCRVRAAQRDYVQVNQYLEGQGIGRHRDSTVVTSRPLVQCVVLMSQPEVDFLGGELILYNEHEEAIRAHGDLGMKRCDVLLFDKSLMHEVEATKPITEVGRRSAVVGARYGRPHGPRRMTRRLSEFVRDTFARSPSSQSD